MHLDKRSKENKGLEVLLEFSCSEDWQRRLSRAYEMLLNKQFSKFDKKGLCIKIKIAQKISK